MFASRKSPAPLVRAVYRVGSPERFAFLASPHQTASVAEAEVDAAAFRHLGWLGVVLPVGVMPTSWELTTLTREEG